MKYYVSLTTNYPDGDEHTNEAWYEDLGDLLIGVGKALKARQIATSFVFTVVPKKEERQ